MNLEAAKRELRRQVGARRRALSASSLDSVAERVCEHLFAERAFIGARRVAIYAALPEEVPTRPLFEALTRVGTTCLFPRVAPGGQLCFSRVERWEDLHPRGNYGILEPSEAAPVSQPGDGDVVVVPGVAFDACGNRLGRGKGYYDRALSGARDSQPLLIGAGYELQIVPSVPHDSRDWPMDAIVTEASLDWVARET